MLLDFKHANLKAEDGKSPRVVTIASNLVFGMYRGNDGSTILFANGGAAIPVLETPEEIKIRLGAIHGTSTNEVGR